MTEKRAEGRYLCADLVRLDYIKGEDEVITLEAVLEDISGPGGCVQTEEPVPLASSVTLWLGESRFEGHVCYCAYREYGYFIGIHFAGATQWSTDSVTPQHLTDLSELARAGSA